MRTWRQHLSLRGRWFVGVIALAAFSLAGSGGAAAPETSMEYRIKAACLYNFAKFVEWPESAFATNDSPLVIGVLGDDPFDPELEKIVQGRTISGHPVIVEHARRLEDLKGAHVLFIGRSEQATQAQILGALRDRAVLTVGESDRFLDEGGIIRFVMEGNKVRFDINLDAARLSQLKVSSELLKLARQVRGGNPKG